MIKDKKTKLIVGLGNPGRQYEHSFHNLGFLTIDMLAAGLNLKLKKVECRALTAETYAAGRRIIIAKPQTYMNLSGESVRELIGKYRVDIADMMVIYDDIDIPRATLRIRKEGSAGTHNGMRSIIYCLSDDIFPRLRVGAGRPPEQIPLSDYVLMEIPEHYRKDYNECIKNAADAAGMFINGEPLDKIMQKYN